MRPLQNNLASDSIKVVPGRSKVRVESSNPVPKWKEIPDTSKVKLISPDEVRELAYGGNRMAAVATPKFEVSKSVNPNPAVDFKRQIVCGLRSTKLNTAAVRWKTTPNLLQSKIVEPPSPRTLQIRSRVTREAVNTPTVVEGTKVEVRVGAKRHRFEEISQSISPEELSQLLAYRPALRPTWKGRIEDSATPPEFSGEFWAQPAVNIRKKSYRLSKAMPDLLKVELLPTWYDLNDLFKNTSPRLSDVEIYIFSDPKTSTRLKGESAHLSEAMVKRDSMIRLYIKGAMLLIFSSKLLDKASQFIIKTQAKAENFLWGLFLPKSEAILPETAYQTDDENVVDMDIDTEKDMNMSELESSSEPLKLHTDSPNTPASANKNKEVNLPPGFEEIWTPPPLVKLNIQGTSNPESNLTRTAGIVRDEFGRWVFGYTECHKNVSEIIAGLWTIYNGLKSLWDSGFRRIRLESTSLQILDALTTTSYLVPKKNSVLNRCKDMILKNWECRIYLISQEQNSCALWLATSRLEEERQGLVLCDDPPPGLVDLLEKDRQVQKTA